MHIAMFKPDFTILDTVYQGVVVNPLVLHYISCSKMGVFRSGLREAWGWTVNEITPGRGSHDEGAMLGLSIQCPRVLATIDIFRRCIL